MERYKIIYNNRESIRHFNRCSKCSANSEEVCVRRGVERWVAEAKGRSKLGV